MRYANSSATEGNLSVLYGEYLQQGQGKGGSGLSLLCTQAQKVSLTDARCIFMSKDVQILLYFLPESYRLPNWVRRQGVFITVMRPPDCRHWNESFPSKWVTNHLVYQMYPSEQVHSNARCFPVFWLCCASFLHHQYPPRYSSSTHSPTSYLFFCQMLILKDLGSLCSYLDSGSEMSCSHAIDVDRNRAHFPPMCCWSLRQNVQDVFWLPRIPGGIIIPSLSFPHSAPSALLSPSPPLGLYALLYRAYSLYSIGSHLFCLGSSCQRNYWRKHSTPDTPRCASRQTASAESMPLEHPQTLKVFWVLV